MACSGTTLPFFFFTPRENRPLKFQNLEELSPRFKNEIAAPIRSDILTNQRMVNSEFPGAPERGKAEDFQVSGCEGPVEHVSDLQETVSPVS
jgi:hypothetical protein